MKTRIALLYGGESSEHNVSLMGYEYVKELLAKSKYEILPVYITRDGKWLIGGESGKSAYLSAYLGGSLYTEYGFISIDAAIPLLHGPGGEDGSIQGALDNAGIAYIGANTATSAVCIDKTYTKSIVSSLGIPVVDGVSFSRPADTEAAMKICEDKIGFPMFIKPRRLGSSVGAYPIHNEHEFKERFPTSMRAGGNLVTAERMLTKKRELECAFCEIGGQRIITEPGEIIIRGFYGYDEKYSGKTETPVKAEISAEIAGKIAEYAKTIADALTLRHLARIDFFLTDEGLFFNEVNTFPGFTKTSLYPKMLEAAGIHPRDALISFIEDALCS